MELADWLSPLQPGDLPTWVGIVISLIFSISALGVSIRALKWQRIGAEMQEIAAHAAVRQADAAERAIDLSEQQLQPGPTTSADRGPGSVSWALEHPGGHKFLLRNTGDVTATGVTIDEGNLPISRLVPKDARIRPEESVEFLMIPAWGRPVPSELWVTWDGSKEPAAVRVPH
ncbi:hypothetical protein [Actinopolymorpha alba]|uniref:hypothetical protein n=1 Tax=Actinopolymorpha alba TaxID=533267 RepID=UPI00037BE476|nr:hypothetical protein [Actinopolymorpha alba]